MVLEPAVLLLCHEMILEEHTVVGYNSRLNASTVGYSRYTLNSNRKHKRKQNQKCERSCAAEIRLIIAGS